MENDKKWVPESAIPDAIRDLDPIFGPNILIHISASREGSAQPDFEVRVRWQGTEYEFVAEAKSRNTPRVLDEALRQARRWSADTGKLPMVIVPFLGEQRIDRLAQEGVSGLDLCGNGLIVVPGKLFLRRTGRPNQYPESRPARFAYRGTTSLVPRVFLRRPVYELVSQVRDEIKAGGAIVALSTVSKAIARMTDDLVIDRAGERIALVQPDKLLDLLAEHFQRPKPDRVSKARMKVPLGEVFSRVRAHGGLRLVLSGASSHHYYAAGMRADEPVLYCDRLDDLRDRLGDAWQPTERFADLTVIETRDQTPFFDVRRDANGVVYASPVQSYLELNAAGEKRDRDLASEIRKGILRDAAR